MAVAMLVTGATGTIGRLVVQHLRDLGADFKAVVRTRERGEGLAVPYVVADFDDVTSLGRALIGARSLFLNGAAHEGMVRQQTSVIDAALAAGVTHVVRVSAAGSSTTSDRAVNRWHGELDAYLERTRATSSLLRPTFFTQNLLRSREGVRSEGRLYGAFGEGRLAFVDAEDIARCAVRLLTGDAAPGGSFVLTGRETLSFADVAAKLSLKLGRPVSYVDRPAHALVAAMTARGLAPSVAESFGQMMRSFAAGGASAITTTVRDLTGREARTVDDFLDDHLDPFR